MKRRIDDNFWLFNIPITHRGLFDEIYPENSLGAYKQAIDHGYAIELDVQMSVDGVLFCFHDDNAKRLCKVDKDVRDLTYQEIRNLSLNETNYYPPTFKEVLAYIDGKTPLCIEIKTQKYKGIEEKVVSLLKEYKGKFVVQSFNPKIMKKIGNLAPEFIIGVLTTRESSKNVPKIINYAMHKLWFKYYLKFDFLNVRVQDLEFYNKKLSKFLVICWTCKNENDRKIAEKYAKNIIFEKTLKDLGKFKK